MGQTCIKTFEKRINVTCAFVPVRGSGERPAYAQTGVRPEAPSSMALCTDASKTTSPLCMVTPHQPSLAALASPPASDNGSPTFAKVQQ